MTQNDLNFSRIEKAIYFLIEHRERQPALSEVARHVHLSEYHFQRLFTEWAGISPKRFLQFLNFNHAENLLRRGSTLLDATFETGLSSPGRLHDLAINIAAVTPGEIKNRGKDLLLHWTFSNTKLGRVLVARTSRGLCHLQFVTSENESAALVDLRHRWAGAELQQHSELQLLVDSIFDPETKKGAVDLHLSGTNFQVKVWEALLRIPEGKTIAYGTLAGVIGKPRAVRAVASAVAANPLHYLIPCHRVIRNSGALGDYAGGAARKSLLLAREFKQTAHDQSSRLAPLSLSK